MSIRLVIYLIFAGLVAAGVVYLSGLEGVFNLSAFGYRFENVPVGLGIGALIVLAFVVIFVDRIWRLIRSLPGRVGHMRTEARRHSGLKALTRGLVALAVGDVKEAQKQTRNVERLLEDQPLSLLLSAQTAQLEGDEKAAEKFFRAMAGNREMRFLGLRGLITQAINRGETAEALKLAEEAYESQPRAEWVVDSLIRLYAKEEQWSALAEVAARAGRRKVIESGLSKRHRAAALMQKAEDARERGDPELAADYYKDANKADPGFAPAAAAYARDLLRHARKRRAETVLKKAWAVEPHPELLAVFEDAEPVNKPLDRLQRRQTLTGPRPRDEYARLVLAEAAVDAEMWGEARKHLNVVLRSGNPAEAHRLMAEVDMAELENDAAARDHFMRATNAEPAKAWICESCGAAQDIWRPFCAGCGAFDSLKWDKPVRIRQIEDLTEDERHKPAPREKGQTGQKPGARRAAGETKPDIESANKAGTDKLDAEKGGLKSGDQDGKDEKTFSPEDAARRGQ